jgi:hypothetical protein
MDLTQLYCDVDDFIRNNPSMVMKKISNNKRRYTPRSSKLSRSEVMTICIAFHQSGYRNFKHFYLSYVFKYLSRQFQYLVSYNRFVELSKENAHYLAAFLQSRFDAVTGISYIDSTPIQVCKPKRMYRHKVFKGIAKKGKSTIGWFFGFKLHLIINEVGGLLAVKLTKGNTDDRTPVSDMSNTIFAKLFGDKGYISQKLTEELQTKNIQLITGIKKNMKNKLLTIMDKLLLRKRSIIETINDQIKNISQVEHSRHRSVWNFMVNLVCGLIAYTYQPKKPSITFEKSGSLALI